MVSWGEERGQWKEEHTFALQRRSEVGVIVTITTDGPVAMETGGSAGWVRDKREYTHIHTQLEYTYIYTYMNPHRHAPRQSNT